MAKDSLSNSLLLIRLGERMEQLDTNPTAVGKEAGLSASAVRNIFEGKSKNPRSDTIAAIAKVLKTTPAYLLGQEAPSETVPSDMLVPSIRPDPKFFDESKPLPVFASAEGGDGALILSSDPIDHIPRPAILANVKDAFGVVIEGESMVRSYRPGDVAWINTSLGARRDEDCIFRGFNNETGEARAVIKVLVNWSSTEWTVEQLNPPKRYKISRTEWPECYRVVGSTKRP